jgi:hypothetical protein
MDQSYEIDFAPIKTPLAEIPLAIVNRIKRERMRELSDHHPGLPGILKLLTQVVRVTWDSIRFLCANAVQYPARRQEFAVAVPPLNRSMLDALFAAVFLFDKPSSNTRWYYAGGWRESLELQARLVERYGGREEWKSALEDHARTVAGLVEDAKITSAEAANPKTVRHWPHPGGMLRGDVVYADQSRRAFLEFLNVWFYGRLSGDSHLSILGLARRGRYFVEFEKEGQQEEQRVSLGRYHGNVILGGVTLYVAYLSELAGQLCLEHECLRLREVWNHLRRWPEVQDLLVERYDSWLCRRAG